MRKENQFSRVAKLAYSNIIRQNMPYDEAWDNATEEEIKSETT